MKKLLLIAIIIITACSKDSAPAGPEIFGTWGRSAAVNPHEVQDDYVGNYLSVTRFIFKNDNTFENFSFVMDEDSLEIIGYWNRMQGTFSQQGNRLLLVYDLYNAEPVVGSDFPYMDKEELVLAAEGLEWEFNYSILENNSILKFDFDPCGPLENCIGGMTLVRIK